MVDCFSQTDQKCNPLVKLKNSFEICLLLKDGYIKNHRLIAVNVNFLFIILPLRETIDSEFTATDQYELRAGTPDSEATRLLLHGASSVRFTFYKNKQISSQGNNEIFLVEISSDLYGWCAERRRVDLKKPLQANFSVTFIKDVVQTNSEQVKIVDLFRIFVSLELLYKCDSTLSSHETFHSP